MDNQDLFGGVPDHEGSMNGEPDEQPVIKEEVQLPEHSEEINKTADDFRRETAYGPETGRMGQGAYGQDNNYRQDQYAGNGYGPQQGYPYPQNQQGYSQNNQNGYGYQGYQPELEEPVKMSEWVLLLVLLNFVPCVGDILAIVWAFSKDEKKSKTNFCKAYLIIFLIRLVLGIALLMLYGGILLAAINAGY